MIKITIALLLLSIQAQEASENENNHIYHGNGVDFTMVLVDFTLKDPTSCTSEINRFTLYKAMDKGFVEANGVAVVDEEDSEGGHYWDLDLSFCETVPEKYQENDFALVKGMVIKTAMDLLGCPSDDDFVQFLDIRLLGAEVCLSRRTSGTKTALDVGRRNLNDVPAEFSMKESSGPVRDQGQSGSCVAYAADGMMQIYETLHNREAKPFSPKYLYVQRCRVDVAGGAKTCGPGIDPSNVGELVNQIGMVREENFPSTDLTDKMFEDQVPASVKEMAQEMKPQYHFPWSCYYEDDFTSKKQFKNDVKWLMYNYGPMMVVFPTHNHDGCDMWNSKGKRNTGPHAMVFVAYNDKGLWIRNSWGNDWCNEGHVFIGWKKAYKKFYSICHWEKFEDENHADLCVNTPFWNDGDPSGPFDCIDYANKGWCENCEDGPKWKTKQWGSLKNWGVLENCCHSCECWYEHYFKNSYDEQYYYDDGSYNRLGYSRANANAAEVSVGAAEVSVGAINLKQSGVINVIEQSAVAFDNIQIAKEPSIDIAKEISFNVVPPLEVANEGSSKFKKILIGTTIVNLVLFGLFGEQLIRKSCDKKKPNTQSYLDLYEHLAEQEV